MKGILSARMPVVASLTFVLVASCSTERRDWDAAQQCSSIQEYEAFLTRYPQGRYAPEARNKIEELAFTQCEQANTVEAYQRFLEQYAHGVFSQKAKVEWDDLDWQVAGQERSYSSGDRYLASHPQGRHAGEAQAWLATLRNARSAGFRDVRTITLDIHQSFDEKVDSVTIGFESEIAGFLPYFGLRMVEPDSSADAVMTVTCSAEALGDHYALFGVGYGTYYYTGARVSGRLRLETPGGRALNDSYRGECPTPQSVTSPSTDPSDAPYDVAMRDGFPPRAVTLLARAFGYPALVGALASLQPGVRDAAVDVFRSGGEAVRELLLSALDDSVGAIQSGAVQALAGHRDARVVAALVRCLGREGDDNRILRDRAAESLSALGPFALEALESARTDARALVREGVANALGGIRAPESRAMLVALLDDSVKAVKDEAIAALGAHRSREALDILIDRLAHDEENRTAYLDAVGRSTYQDTEEEPDVATTPVALWDTPRVRRLIDVIPLLDSDQAVTSMLNAIGEPAVPALVQALKAGHVRIRTCAARALGGVFDDRAITALQAAATDTSRDVRLAVAQGLSFQGSGESVAQLARLLGDTDPEIRAEALTGLKNSLGSTDSRKDYQRYLASPETIRLLTETMNIRDASKTGQRDAAAEILGRIGPPCVDALLVCLGDSNRYGREGAITALAASGDQRAIAALIGLTGDPSLQSDADLTTRLYGALGESRDPRVFDTLLQGLADTTGTRRTACIRALSPFGDPKAVDALVPMLGGDNPGMDRDIRQAIQTLTDYYPEEEPFDWKTWWQENRRSYGLK